MKSAKRQHHRAGMTLVELLVVVSILLLLSAVVLPTLAGGKGDRAIQLSAANVATQLAKSQSQAISRRATVGVWMAPLANAQAACVDMYVAQVPDAYRGDTYNARFQITPLGAGTASLTAAAVDIASLTSPAFGDFTKAGNLIQFNDTGAFFDFRLIGSAWVAAMRPTASQVTANTIWPAPPPAAHRFAIHRLPSRTGEALSLSNGTAIDLVWSGIGSQRFGVTVLAGDGAATPFLADDWTYDPDYLAASGAGAAGTVVTLFDAAGSLSEICYVAASSGASSTRFVAQGPVYFLIGRIDRCGLPYNAAPTEANPGANWQYSDSRWVAVDPRTGVSKTAAPSLRTALGVPVTNARDSQALVRSGLGAGTP